MKVLISIACVAITAFVGYFFWSEYQASRVIRSFESSADAEYKDEMAKACSAWVLELTSWKNGRPIGKANSFAEARNEVENCLVTLKGTAWYSDNIHVKYW